MSVVSKKKPVDVNNALLETEDLLIVVFGYLDFPTLVLIQRVCTYWRFIFKGRLGNKPFATHQELFDRVIEYCRHKARYGYGIATTYGWPIGKWDVSQITDFSGIFFNQITFNEDIGEWNISNATTLSLMFCGASSFNQDLSRWNTSKVTMMNRMFMDASSFNGHIMTWDTSNVTSMTEMFFAAASFHQDISEWDVSNVTCCMMFSTYAESFEFGFLPKFRDEARDTYCV
mmetsp:Transcript_22680/g.34279  ORF Transcript_22680/g.34279 Transcript_22680/m.34279 type:complete len:230 (-) Transcript_22680:48-737(-)